MLRSSGIRAKLAIGSAADPEEKEADQIADRVMRKPAFRCNRRDRDDAK